MPKACEHGLSLSECFTCASPKYVAPQQQAEPVAYIDYLGRPQWLPGKRGRVGMAEMLYASPPPRIAAEQVEQLKRLRDWHQHQLTFIPEVGAPADLHREAVQTLDAALDALAKGE